MKNIIYLILFLAVNFGFGQKNYAFNLYTSYGFIDREGNNAVNVIFSDTLNDQHTLRIFSKNGSIGSVVLFDNDLRNKYIFKLEKKSLNNVDFTKDFNDYNMEPIFNFKNNNYQFCSRYKNYEVNSVNKSDSLAVDTFTFYTNKRKKKIKLIIEVESLKGKKALNRLPYEDMGIITHCIAPNFESKIITKINSKRILKEELISEYETKLIEINTTNFSINVK